MSRKNDTNESKNKHRRIGRIILLILLILSVIAFYTIPSFRQKLTQILMLFRSASVESIIGFIRSYGPYAAAISFGLMVFQSVAAPLPAFLITFANVAIFGWWKGAILSWTSAMAGAALCFLIARIAGRDGVEKLTSINAISSVDKYFERYGRNTILICRLLPFVSFDFVSYAAGLTSMGIVPFLIATGIGQLPATLVYSYVGGMLTGGTKLFVTGLLILFALSGFVVLIKRIYNEKHDHAEGGPEKEEDHEHLLQS